MESSRGSSCSDILNFRIWRFSSDGRSLSTGEVLNENLDLRAVLRYKWNTGNHNTWEWTAKKQFQFRRLSGIQIPFKPHHSSWIEFISKPDKPGRLFALFRLTGCLLVAFQWTASGRRSVLSTTFVFSTSLNFVLKNSPKMRLIFIPVRNEKCA